MEQLFTLLQAVVMLMTALANPGVPAEVKAQGELIANQAIVVVNTELARLAQQPQQPSAPSTSITNNPNSGTNTGTMVEDNTPAPQGRLEIVSPMRGTGLGRQYKATEDADRSLENYVELGVVVYKADGSVDKDAVVEITATDGEQNKTLNGTHTYSGLLKKYVHEYRYDFKTAGEHTITFKSGDLTQSVTLQAE